MAGRDASDNDKGAAPSLTIDYALYDKYLEGSDLTEDQKREFLDALRSVIVEFVMLGFEVHPTQEVCGKRSLRSPESVRAAVQLKRSKKNHFTKAASGTTAQAAERIQE